MFRPRASAIAAAVVAFASIASASPGPRKTVTIPPQVGEHALTAGVLYLNRFRPGVDAPCTITKGADDDARTRTSRIPQGSVGTQFTLSPWAHGDAVWAEFLQCMKEVYSPYQVTVTDVRPDPGVPYNENIVAGTNSEINYPGAGGVAPKTADCSPYSYAISYSFANIYPPLPLEICWTAAQETAHAYGLDHEFEFTDGRSACNDPMTYRDDCGGQKFFRNEGAFCGEFSKRDCDCSSPQNSHQRLIAALGAGTPITPPPTVDVTQPLQGEQIKTGATVKPVLLTASSKRGVKVVELYINKPASLPANAPPEVKNVYKWAERKGVVFGPNGQPAAAYMLDFPAMVPDGVLDISVEVKDDIDITTIAPTITVKKGNDCVNAETDCLKGMKCDAGKCFWDPPTGEVGDPCTYPQFCLSARCEGPAGKPICTQGCVPGVGDSCPMGFECLANGPGSGICYFPDEDTGCCSASVGTRQQLLALGLVIGVGLVLGRRRTARARRRAD
jgi:hypothetical protein